MNKIVNIFIKSSLITSFFLLILGLLLVFKSEATIVTISYILGAILVALGVLAIINFIKREDNQTMSNLDIIYGIVTIILGILVIENPKVIGTIIPIIVGIGIIINSGTKLKYAFDLKAVNNNIWKCTVLISIFTTICGVVLLFNPFKATEILTQIVGMCISVYSILDIISTIVIKKNFTNMSAVNKIEQAKIIKIEEEGKKNE